MKYIYKSGNLAPDNIAHFDLVCIVNNELIAPHSASGHILNLTQGNLDIVLYSFAFGGFGPFNADSMC